MTLKHFKELDVWKLSVEITKGIYLLTKDSDFSKDFGLKDQIRRAAISVSSNIAEGFDRSSNKEFVRFLRISKSSLSEVQSQLFIAKELDYVSEKKFNDLNFEIENLANQISRLINYLKTNIAQNATK